MSNDIELDEQVLAIASDIFTSLIDREPGGVNLWYGPDPDVSGALHAWVDVHGGTEARAVVTARRSTCDALVRELMSMDAQEEVSSEDLLDALGEVANVVGGNLKALTPESGTLTLPTVSHRWPDASVESRQDVVLSWRGDPVIITLCGLTHIEGDPS